jgi:hypothetical protein
MLALIPSGTEVAALVFGRYIHPTSILMIYSSVVLCRTKFKTVYPIWKNLKIFIGMLQIFLQNSFKS